MLRRFLLFLGLFVTLFSQLSAQNPMTRQTRFQWEEPLRRFVGHSESRYEYNGQDQEVAVSYWKWDSLSQLRLDSRVLRTYHPNGTQASWEEYGYRPDGSLERYYRQQTTANGYYAGDSSAWFSQGVWRIQAHRYFYTFSPSDQLLSSETIQWNDQRKVWEQTLMAEYQYDPQDCLIEVLTRYPLYFQRKKYTTDSLCRRLVSLRQVGLSSAGPWQNVERRTYQYTDFPDSLREVGHWFLWDSTSQDWKARQYYELTQNVDDQLLRYYYQDAEGGEYESVNHRNAQGDLTFIRERGRDTGQTDWEYYFESDISYPGPTERSEFNKFNYNLLEKRWEGYSRAQLLYDEEGRWLRTNRRDSIYDGEVFVVSEREDRQDFVFFCEGSVQTAATFSNDYPLWKTTYAYRDETDCETADISPLTVYPNPAQRWVFVQSETLADPQTQVIVLDLMGRPVPIQSRVGEGLTHRTVIDVGQLTPGTYVLQLLHPNFQQTQKFMVHR